jgi:hypothetical protein
MRSASKTIHSVRMTSSNASLLMALEKGHSSDLEQMRWYVLVSFCNYDLGWAWYSTTWVNIETNDGNSKQRFAA